MLILTRMPGQSVKIGQDINVKVLSIKGKQIMLGFEVPRNISIHRDDIKNIIKEPENQAKDGTSFSEDTHND